MSFWESVRGWFKSETASARDLADDLKQDWSADLDRKEAELSATPEERIEQLQDQISENASAFDEIKAKIETTGHAPDDTFASDDDALAAGGDDVGDESQP